MKRILFVYNTKPTFVQLDEFILSEKYHVKSVYAQHNSIHLWEQMWQYTQDVDLVVAWFASWHSLPAFVAAAARRLPRVLITGGYDVACEPTINYGLRLGGLPKLVSGLVFRLATVALPFSETSYHEALKNTPLKSEKTTPVLLGLPDNPLFVIPVQKEAIALTIATIDRVSTVRKGIRSFVEAAALLPDVKFMVVGKARDDAIDTLRAIASPNVTFTGYLSDNELAQLLCRAKVYVQPSIHEGFGLAVAEAMLARCIPVVSRKGSLPEIVGSSGIYTDTTAMAIANATKLALHSDEQQLGELARQRILDRFLIEKRSKSLYDIIDRLLVPDS